MKIRTSFVTNSSSSSFVIVNINNSVLANILNEFIDELEELFSHIDVNGNNVYFYDDEGYCDFPSKLEDVFDCILSIFDPERLSEDDDVDEDELDDYEITGYKIAKLLIEKKDEFLQNIGDLEIATGHSGWAGDDETRFDEDWYEEDTLKEIKESIMEQKGYQSEDEVTDDDFCEYVCDMTNTDTTVFKYNNETKEVERYRRTELY